LKTYTAGGQLKFDLLRKNRKEIQSSWILEGKGSRNDSRKSIGSRGVIPVVG